MHLWRENADKEGLAAVTSWLFSPTVNTVYIFTKEIYIIHFWHLFNQQDMPNSLALFPFALVQLNLEAACFNHRLTFQPLNTLEHLEFEAFLRGTSVWLMHFSFPFPTKTYFTCVTFKTLLPLSHFIFGIQSWWRHHQLSLVNKAFPF